ncbi:MAG: hypothetical protein CVU44_03300 [Chloroflexi bacterium HGW-Chloroflexi-6]|nr:MAG: hypothetical protein CVU44_03300 [Chloroflexi bacterium HGW-Chloroflexi-6]
MLDLGTIGSIIIWLAGIVVLVKLFQTEGVMKGILGFICMLYTFIWGWQNIGKEELKLKTWMYLWSGAIVLGIILNVVGASSGGE